MNAQAITVEPNETLLQAALRQGVEIPFSCRVGGCGTCRCTLVEGRVKELTETSYLLSEEFDRGVILACQSVPQTDVRVVVDLSRQPARRNVTGRVIGQHRLTHDITCLRVQLDQGLPYKAGQSARISVGALPGVARQYSFATPVRPDAQVEFFVRRVRGGLFSSLVNDQDLVGQSVQLEGPLGDFQLHPAEAPLLFVAGGSGLAPVLAMLREAAAAGVSRPTSLLFGARGRRDLYATEEIDALARNWRGAFRFVPVLSEADSDAGWQGERGLVAEKIPSLLAPGAHVYLCGPPAMIDSAAVLLQRQGVPHDRVHADRFTSSHEGGATAPAPRPGVPPATGAQRADAGALHYLKFFLFHAVGLFAAAALLAGGPFVTGALLAVSAFYLIGDAVCGDDTSTPRYRHPGILTAQLWLALPLLALIVFAAVWGVSTGDPLGFGAFVTQWTGYDVLAARAATGFGHRVSAFILTGLTIGMIGTITAHELTHRTWDPVSMLIGRWLLAFSFDTSFAIEHVYGHHRYVSTVEDPATAPRGRNVYFHIVASTLRGNASAWKIEARRLRRSGHGRLSWHNAVIRGHLASALLVAIAWTMGGWQAALFFTLCALWGKALLEIVNYMEHYGMVRDPRTPVQPRHSWNTNRRISSWSMFNLTRHSHHHAQGEVPYQDLKPFSDAPTMIGGYLTTIVVAMIPPLWHRLMTPRVLQWDRDHASDEERGLAAQANARSGIPMLQAAGAAAGHGPGAPA